MTSVVFKMCKGCRQDLPADAFAAHPGSRDRLQQKCRACLKEYDARRYPAQREKMIARAMAWNVANKDRHVEIRRAADARRTKTEHRRTWFRENSYRYAMKVKEQTPAWASLEDIGMYYEVARVLSRGGVPFHVDHVIPLKGRAVCGLHVETNLQVIPAFQNVRKHAKFSDSTFGASQWTI